VLIVHCFCLFFVICQGRKYLAHAMSLNVTLVDFLHRAIKNQVPYAPK
jgi:hypothetical protein